ncbi:hypothetical protein [Arcticibacter eurypsychrophilus]|uniref:hypothetical protein n=1 Tax=Arcticibacter eurypsychrophilus TaxID=1434752 RepID=UPI00084D8BA1|nr:hypothetical protein [Arcticibacter eurypsychrophilus]
MRTVYGLWFFYKKLIIPSLVVSIALSYLMTAASNFLIGIGISYIFLTPTFHYLTYELKNPNEYYFYYNIGLSKFILWTNTLVISTMIGLLFMLI